MSETVYDITIRDAREEDAEFLGKVILAAAHLTNMSIDTPGTGTYPNTDNSFLHYLPAVVPLKATVSL